MLQSNFSFIIDEPGVFIGKILPNNPTRAFLGYVDEKASEKKVVRDIFTKGDSAFISGAKFGLLYVTYQNDFGTTYINFHYKLNV